jgi:hypothetical protein
MMSDYYQILGGSDYMLTLKHDARPDRAWLKSTPAADLARCH